MILDPTKLSVGAMYHFMISAVVPRPIAFVSTVAKNGTLNVAPFSYFNAISSAPPLIGISVNLRGGVPKDTLANIRETRDFVVNVVSEELAQRMVHSSGDWPQDVDEFHLTGLTPVPSDVVQAPRVGESPIQMECRLHSEIALGNSFFVVGEILRAHISEEVLTDGKVDIRKLRPVGRLGGSGYSVVREAIEIPRPQVGR